jgi:hypothetical protein
VSAGNSLTRTLRNRTIYLAILIIFGAGAIVGSFVAAARHACAELAADQRRIEALFAILAETQEHDGAKQSSAALRTFANQAAEASHPQC